MAPVVRHRLVLGLLAWWWLSQAGAAPLENRLAGHPAPYLALHGQDPVAWQEWNEATVARARAENKLLFVSVGYFACHWCHVMQRESYRDPAIATRLNRDFIPVKVDRELNGALDAGLIAFAERVNGLAGWPLNAFVTPEGYPLHVVLYEPPDAFSQVLAKVAPAWQARAGEMATIAREAAPALVAPAPVRPLSSRSVSALTQAFQVAAETMADPLQGGFGRVSKFPMTAQLGLLLELEARASRPARREFLLTSLDHMIRYGLRDAIQGGFFRYTVDPDWRTPHFEKMLYDNALLAVLYSRAAQVLGRPEYQAVAHETLDFLLAALRDPAGGYMTSLSALDAAQREGGAYLWEPADLERHLDPHEYVLVARTWQLSRPREFDPGYLPMMLSPPAAPDRDAYRKALDKLKAVARTRTVPKDTKIASGLNGLALSAFSLAGKGVPRFDAAARELAAFISLRLMADGDLLRATSAGRDFPDAELDDYAHVGMGLLTYGQAHADPGARNLAQTLADTAWRRFHGPAGWRREARPLLATLKPEPALADEAMPSASGRLILLSLQSGDVDLRQRAQTGLGMALAELESAPFDHATSLMALLEWQRQR